MGNQWPRQKVSPKLSQRRWRGFAQLLASRPLFNNAKRTLIARSSPLVSEIYSMDFADQNQTQPMTTCVSQHTPVKLIKLSTHNIQMYINIYAYIYVYIHTYVFRYIYICFIINFDVLINCFHCAGVVNVATLRSHVFTPEGMHITSSTLTLESTTR